MRTMIDPDFGDFMILSKMERAYNKIWYGPSSRIIDYQAQ